MASLCSILLSSEPVESTNFNKNSKFSLSAENIEHMRSKPDYDKYCSQKRVVFKVLNEGGRTHYFEGIIGGNYERIWFISKDYFQKLF